MEVDWTKILEKPDGKYKVDGNTLLKFRITTEKLNEELDSLRKKNSEMEKVDKQQKENISKLQSEIKMLKSTTENMDKEGKEKVTSLEQQLKDIMADKESEFQTQLSSIEKELKENKNKLSDFQDQLTQTEDKLKESISKITELEQTNNELTEKNKSLENRLNEFEPQIKEIESLKAEASKLQSNLDEKLAEATQLNEKLKSLQEETEAQRINTENDHKKEIETLKATYEKQLEELKAECDNKIQEIKDIYGLTAKEAKITGDEQVIFLRYSQNDFLMVKNKPEDGISLILDNQEGKWLLVWDEKSSFIDRRTAERIARSIAKAGWAVSSGARVGMGFELEIQGDKKVPERLLREQHKYME